MSQNKGPAITGGPGLISNTPIVGPYVANNVNPGFVNMKRPVQMVAAPWRISTNEDELSKASHLSIAAMDMGGMRIISYSTGRVEVQMYTADGTKYLTISPDGFSDGTTTIDIGDAAARFSTWVMMTCRQVVG